MVKELVYVTTSLFPRGQAYSDRARYLSAIFAALGYRVHVVADGDPDGSEGGRFEYGDYSIVPSVGGLRGRFSRGHRGARHAIELIRRLGPELVVIGNAYDRFSQVQRHCRRAGIPVILEICERYDPDSFRWGRLNPAYRAFVWAFSYSYPRADGVIAISRLLQEHFESLGLPTVRIPSILDPCSWLEGPGSPGGTELVHVGFSGRRKELLGPVINAVRHSHVTDVRYSIYGMDEAAVRKNFPESDLGSVSDRVSIHGRVSQASALAAIRRASASVFVRPRKRASEAGFPTKLAESLMCGTPVITNRTGDIELVLKDGINGYLLADASQHAIEDAIERLAALTPAQSAQMRAAARRSAEMAFDYRRYERAMATFLRLVAARRLSYDPEAEDLN